ncbi:MAG: PHP domain-containing protein, partial [Enhydrobacter sp.]
MAIADFIHLKVRSAYSLTEGANKVDKVVSLAKEQAMPAVAVTDRGNLFGALEFAQYASKAGIQPIIGCDLAIRREEESGVSSNSKIVLVDWLTLLVQDEAGYLNLMRLVSRAHLEFKTGSIAALPLIELEGHTDGLLAMTGSADSTLGRMLGAGQTPAAGHQLDRLQKLFGDRLYIELQRHGEDSERRIEGPLLELAYARGIPLVATNDVHFPKKSMFEAHDVLLCIEQGVHIDDPNRRRLTPEYYFKSAAEMREVFADLPEACDNTLVVAQRCAYMPMARKPILPSYTKLEGRTEGEALRALAREGLEELQGLGRLAADIDFAKYEARLVYELDMIEKMGFSGYFLIVWDFINWAKEHGIPVGPGRGSASGSMIAYAMGITDIDPIKFK